MKKRVLTFVMFVCMMVSLIPMAGVYAFSDVTEETTYGTAIMTLESWGKIEGYGDGTYKPDELINRAEFVKMLMSLKENSGIEYIDSDVKTGFEDVDSENHWAAKYIKLAVNKKVIRGYEDGSFRPKNKVTYEEALKMVTCYLGYELRAKARADANGMDLWPNGYIAVANELMITKSISVESFSSQVTRGAVAQIIYNASSVPEVDPNTQQPITTGTSSVTGVTGGGSGRPSGGGGGGGGGNNSIRPGTLESYGVIVATNDTFIDDTAYLENNGRISSAYMIFREDRSGAYIKLFTGYKAGETGYTNMIGYRVKLTYKEIDDTTVNYQVVKADVKDTQTVTVDAEEIFKVENNIFRYEEKVGGKWVSKSIKYDISNMQFMYNGVIVRNEYGMTDNMEQLMSEEDLKPEVGSVKLVDTDGNGTADYGIIEAYTTIVVGECKTESVQENPNDANSKYKRYTVKDKFVTTGEGENATPKTYVFDDKKLVTETGQEANPTLSAWDVVYLAQPKDLSKTIIRVSSKTTKKTVTIQEIDVNGYTMMDTSRVTYTTSQYFQDYVWETIKEEAQESGVKLVLYMDPGGKVAAAQIGEPSYTAGYLIQAAMDTQSNDLVLRIVTSGNKTKKETQQYAISNTAKIDGKAVKKDAILQMLKDNVAPIQAGKPQNIMVNAEMAQPIRFEVSGVSKNSNLPMIKNLDVVPAEENYLFQEGGTAEHGAKRYISTTSEKGFGSSINAIDFTVSTSATVILLPNNRYETQYYQIGTLSSLASKYLKANETYNVEPYLIPKAEGGEEIGVVVIYYEDTYATAAVSSPVAIVKEIKDALDADGQPVKKIETISASTSASTSSSMTYTAEVSEVLNAKHYGAEEGAPLYEVKTGDIITFGKTMDDKNICNIQILFDVSERNSVNQQKHLQLKESGNVHNDDETEAHYRVVLGKVTSIPDGTTAQMRARIYVDDDSISEQLRNVTVNVQNKTIYGYDPENANDKPSSQNEDKKTLKFMEYAEVGDYVFIFQTGSTERFTYVIKNRDVVSGQTDVETGNEQTEISSGDANEQQNGDEQSEVPEEKVTENDIVLPDEVVEDSIVPSDETEENSTEEADEEMGEPEADEESDSLEA